MDTLTDEYPYLVHNEYVAGTWRIMDGDILKLSDTASACTITDSDSNTINGYFEYLPCPRRINMYKDSTKDVFLKSLTLIKRSEGNYLMVSDLGDEKVQMYYPASMFISAMTMSNTSATTNNGTAKQLSISYKPSNVKNNIIKWTSSDTDVATVDTTGNVTPHKRGTCIITATTTDGTKISVTCNLTVNQLVTLLNLEFSSVTIPYNGVYTPEIAIGPDDANNTTLNWTSSNSKIVSVSNGTISALTTGSTTITASTTDGSSISKTCKVTVLSSADSPTGITLDATSGSVKERETAQVGHSFSYTTTGTRSQEATVKWVSNDTSIATVTPDGIITGQKHGDTTLTATILTTNLSKNYNLYVQFNPEYVDLGLSSSTLWATCNIGAYSPEEGGLYFAWGETSGYTFTIRDSRSFNWDMYKWCNGAAGSTITKYSTSTSYWDSSLGTSPDQKTALEAEDDAAIQAVDWGSGWTMPTHEQQVELVSSCTWNQTVINGVSGYTVTGPNGNTIFLPAAGYRYSAKAQSYNISGNYWSKSLYEKSSGYAWSMHIEMEDDKFNTNIDNRYEGYSIRPVRATIS